MLKVKKRLVKPKTTYKKSKKRYNLKYKPEYNPKPKPDPIYHNRIISLLINKILKHGKRSLSYKLIHLTLNNIKNKTELNPLLILRQAINKLTPSLVLRPKRGRRKNKMAKMARISLPVQYFKSKAIKLAIYWLILSAKERNDKNIIDKLSYELIEASKNKGKAIRKKEEYMKIAEENKIYVFRKKEFV
uniref:ribosomal protein S7 n=1 Tax=Hydnora esculenta TaxID=1851369 RepID=UPI002115C09E|nr:ribosomal protein S7 [Hydnora esculenta]USN93632.1 ribosomal protein S7 [Hydnora esculenta]